MGRAIRRSTRAGRTLLAPAPRLGDLGHADVPSSGPNARANSHLPDCRGSAIRTITADTVDGVIHRCAIGVITDRGKKVILPTISQLTAEEQDYLTRHDEELRNRHANDNTVYCTFRAGASSRIDLKLALQGSEDQFLDVAKRMVESLADTMRGTANAKDCVVALLSGAPKAAAQPDHVTFLKLDARIEAAHLKKAQTGQGVRLEVFKDLLPAPGDMQKGFSWPDPRQPASELILHDTNRGDAAVYFGNAFQLNISSKALETETALADELVGQLGPARARQAVALVNETGGRGDEVVAKIQETYPDFTPTVRPLGAGGALAGLVRPGHLDVKKKRFESDGIELRVPLGRLDAVSTRPEGDDFVTTIRTSTPLTPIDNQQGQRPGGDANDDGNSTAHSG